MSNIIELRITIHDTSFPSLVGGLKEVLKRIESDEDKIQEGIECNYESSYDGERHQQSKDSCNLRRGERAIATWQMSKFCAANINDEHLLTQPVGER